MIITFNLKKFISYEFYNQMTWRIVFALGDQSSIKTVRVVHLGELFGAGPGCPPPRLDSCGQCNVAKWFNAARRFAQLFL